MIVFEVTVLDERDPRLCKGQNYWICSCMVRISFRFNSWHFTFLPFPKLTIFTILPLYIACKIWKTTALTWDRSSWRLVEKFHISAFLCIILYIIEMKSTKQWNSYWKEKKTLWIQKKDTKTSTKRHEWNGKTQKWSFWYFQQCACLNAIYFKPVVTATYRMKNNKSSTKGV